VAWQISGQYLETCSCDYICLCTPANFSIALKRDCVFAVAFRIDEGHFDNVPLSGLNFVVIGLFPGPTMADGNGTIGVITDERANDQQKQALGAIGSGQAGGPWAIIGALSTKYLGTESGPIQFEGKGLSWSFSVPGKIETAIEGMASPVKEGESLVIENSGHPANSRIALARATRSHLHAMGLDWDDVSGNNNAHFMPFRWSA
jgi:hypothetical protein